MKLPINRPLDYIAFSVANRAKFASEHSLAELGIALILSLYCGEQICAGKIKNFAKFTKKQLQMQIGLDRKPAKDCPGLWHYEGDDLVVDIYDTTRESNIISMREKNQQAGKKGMESRWKKITPAITDVITPAIAPDITSKEEEKVEDNNKGGGYTTVAIASHVAKPSPPEKKEKPLPSTEEYTAWLAAFTSSIPTLAEYQILPEKIAAAAHAAYLTFPSAKNYAPLLAAYYADTKLKEDSYAKKFWRPTGDLLFDNLSDVIHNHAERWGKYTGWFRKQRKAAIQANIQNTLTPDNNEGAS